MNNRKSKKVIDDKKVSIDINNDVSSKTNNQDIKKNEVNQEKENEINIKTDNTVDNDLNKKAKKTFTIMGISLWRILKLCTSICKNQEKFLNISVQF